MFPPYGQEYEEYANTDKADKLLDFAQSQLNSNPDDEEAKYSMVHAYYLLSKYNDALAIAHKYLAEFTNKTWIGRLVNRIGSTYFMLGNYIEAKNYYLNAMKILLEYGTPKDMAMILNNIGLMSELEGDYDTALKYYKETVEIIQKHNQSGLEALTLMNIGQIYQNTRSYENALQITFQAEKLCRESNNNFGTCMALYRQFLIHMDLGNFDEAVACTVKHHQLTVEFPDIVMYQRIDELLQALILKNTQTLEAKGQAIVKLKNFCKHENVDFRPKLVAMKSLIDLKIEEYKLFEHKEILFEIERLVNDMEVVVHDNRLFPLIVDIHILKMKIMQAKGDFIGVRKQLLEADTIVEKLGLDYLKMMIKEERQKFEQNLKRMKDVVEKNDEIVKKVELDFLEDYLKSLKL